MAVTKKPVVKKAVAPKATEAPKKVVKKAEAPAPAKKAVAKKAVAAPAKKTVAKAAPAKTAGKKFLAKANKTSDSFKLVEGKQATQDAFIALFHKKLTALNYGEITKEEVKQIQKAYSETLKEVTNLCSFQDTTAGIFYARREIEARVTNPPKAADGLQTLMLKHYELKVRKVLANEDEIKFSGTVSEEDPNVFITVDGQEININDTTASAPVAEEADEEEEVEEEATEEVDEEVEEEEADEELLDEDEE